MVAYPFSTYSAFYVGAKEITLRHENENTKVLEAKLAELEVFKSP
ncbi:hypothetical protein PPIS_b0412 [Pseudoalteromonas piscicida]|uniref:Uncharacterized protein n=1 Tax=Pseudoalteromonas piscicida TaxID=43662 RepID=A0ABM6NKN0_PSEO7|nr:hypothetical protein PPIS_b0412 [Pseudoalteromonas piscicida]